MGIYKPKSLTFFFFSNFHLKCMVFSMSEGESFSMSISGVGSSSSLRSDDEIFFAYFNSFANRNNWLFATTSVVSNPLELFNANELEEGAS